MSSHVCLLEAEVLYPFFFWGAFSFVLDRCSLVDRGVPWNMFLSAQQVYAQCYCSEEPVQHSQPCCQQREGRRSPELDNQEECWWMGIPLVQAAHRNGACSPGNSGVAGFFVCPTAALISPSRTQLYVNLYFTKDCRNSLWKSFMYFC